MGYYESFFLIKYRGNTHTENYETKLGKGASMLFISFLSSLLSV